MGLLPDPSTPDRTQRPDPPLLDDAYSQAAWLAWSVRELEYEVEAMRVGALPGSPTNSPLPDELSQDAPRGDQLSVHTREVRLIREVRSARP